MTGRLETTGHNVRRIAARIFPAMTAEGLAPRAVADLFTDPLELASALFASQLVDGAPAAPEEMAPVSANRLPPLEGLSRQSAARARDFIPTIQRSEPARGASAGVPMPAAAMAKPFAATPMATRAAQKPERSIANATTNRSEFGVTHGTKAEPAIEQSGLSPIGPTQQRPVVPTSFPPSSARVARRGSVDRSASSIPDTSVRDRAGVPEAAPQPRPREFPSHAQAGSSTRSRSTDDEGVTRWVKGAAGLATLFAPPKPVVATTSPSTAPPSQPAAGHPGAVLHNGAAPSTGSPAPPVSALKAQSASTDVELLMDELERRLELEYLRHYGTSGR
jgi:hypothetical protein